MPLHSPLATLQTKQNVKPVKVINEKDRIIIVKTLFKVKLQALAIELAALLNRSFPTHFFLGNSKVNVLSNSFAWQVLKDYTAKL